MKYSQNNPIWKKDKLGGSNLSIGNYGCTTSSVCTLISYFGEYKTPQELASHHELYTKGGLILWKQLDKILSKMKFLYRYYNFNEEMVDSYLVKNPDTCVLFNVSRGYHWVAGLKKTAGGYLCSDPYPMPAKDRVYKKSDIVGYSVLIKK